MSDRCTKPVAVHVGCRLEKDHYGACVPNVSVDKLQAADSHRKNYREMVIENNDLRRQLNLPQRDIPEEFQKDSEVAPGEDSSPGMVAGKAQATATDDSTRDAGVSRDANETTDEEGDEEDEDENEEDEETEDDVGSAAAEEIARNPDGTPAGGVHDATTNPADNPNETQDFDKGPDESGRSTNYAYQGGAAQPGEHTMETGTGPTEGNSKLRKKPKNRKSKR